METYSPVATSYPVEISGWDREQQFFVEKTALDWSEDSGKRVYLRHPVRDGAVVFVRLLSPTSSGQGFPIAYQVDNVKPVDSCGIYTLQLMQLKPRPPVRSAPARENGEPCVVGQE